MSDFREPMFNRRGKPQIIRKVVRWDKKGRQRPKRARDYRLVADMERVTARYARPCSSKGCKYTLPTGLGWIEPGTEYAKVYANEGQGKRIKGRMIYSPRDYHFECVPEQYRPLVRFLKP